MVGRRGRNLREGDLAEGIGIELLRSFTAVAPVPRTEDTGVDAICTLLEPCNQILRADRSFLVQIKSISIRIFEYHDEAYKWLLGLQIPMFIASVSLKNAEISLYTMQRAVDRLSDNWRGITAYLDAKDCGDDGEDYDHGPDVRNNVHHICLGPPILKWSATEGATEQFRENAFRVMKHWIHWEEVNMNLRPYKICNVPKWVTNEKPAWSSSRYGTELSNDLINDFSKRFGDAMLGLARVCDTSDLPLIIGFIDFLEKKGIKSYDLEVAKGSLKYIIDNKR